MNYTNFDKISYEGTIKKLLKIDQVKIIDLVKCFYIKCLK